MEQTEQRYYLTLKNCNRRIGKLISLEFRMLAFSIRIQTSIRIRRYVHTRVRYERNRSTVAGCEQGT
eukprot:3586264-Pleurochrysis_carterae.AAC.1